MDNLKFDIIKTVILLVVLVFILQFTKYTIRKFSVLKALDKNRRKIVLNLIYLFWYLLALLGLVGVWGFEIDQIAVFISSILAVLGVGFFAQWSILSNLTASVILFFNHPVRIGHRIRILDKDFEWIGEVKDITGFFLFMKTDKGENITIPTSLVLQKGIEILEDKK